MVNNLTGTERPRHSPSRQRTTRGWLAALALAATTLLAACGSGEPELPAAVTNPVTIRIAVFRGAETTALFRIIPEWEHITGNKVELGIVDRATGERAVATDYVTYRDAVIENAEENLANYDVIIVDDPWMPYLAGEGKLTPLSPFGYQTDLDLINGSASLGMWPPPFGPLPPDAVGVPRGAETYALPFVGNVMMLWYRADVIAEPETIDELTQSLRNPDPAYIGSAGIAPSNNPHVFLSWLASRGGDVFDRDWRAAPLRSSIALDAFDEYLREASRLRIPFSDFAPERYEPHARMLDGTAAAAVAWAADAQLVLTSAVSDQIHVTQFPVGRKSSTLTGNWLLAIPSDASNPEAGFDFIKWANSSQIQKTSALLGVPPVRLSLYSDRELISRFPWLPEVSHALQSGYIRPRVPAWDVVEGVIGCALDRSFSRLSTLDPDDPANAEAFATVSSEELLTAADDIESVMEGWGYYRGEEYWRTASTERIQGDPRDEWTCTAVTP